MEKLQVAASSVRGIIRPGALERHFKIVKNSREVRALPILVGPFLTISVRIE